MIVYVESSAATKLILDESETVPLQEFLNGAAESGHSLVCSALLETELRRAAYRAGASQVAASMVLDRFDLLDADRQTFAAAGLLPNPGLRSLDAIHVAAALKVRADLFISYDERQANSAKAAGIQVFAPVP